MSSLPVYLLELHGIEEDNISFAVVDGLTFANAQFRDVHFQNLN
jgi:hypothetical protein